MNDIFLNDFIWSFSKLNLYDTCKYAFYLQYIESCQGIENAFAQFGTCCHEVLESYANKKVEIYELTSEYENLYPKIVTEKFPPNKYKDLNNSYYLEGYKFFSEFEGLDDYKILGVEKEVKFDVGVFKFSGFIDLVLEDNNRNIIIVDHKSKSKMSKEEKEKYIKQLYLYSIPLIDEYKVYPKYLKFNMFRFQEWITEEFKLDKLEETKQWAINTINNIYQEKKWLPKSSKYFCSFICGHRHICQYKP